MNAVELINKAEWDADHNLITVEEYNKRIEPLKDVEIVVRCKDCKYWEEYHKWVRPEGGSYVAPKCNHLMKRTHSNWFCADGESGEV